MTANSPTRLFWFLDQPKRKECLGAWEEYVGEFDEVLGYTALGDFILRNSQTSEYLVFYPQRPGNNAKNYGPFESLAEFRRKGFDEQSFADYCLRPDDVYVLVDRLGPLGESEVYFPVPFPCLGGSGELSTFDKGNVWIYVDLLGQSSL